jgi:hypothetical protein
VHGPIETTVLVLILINRPKHIPLSEFKKGLIKTDLNKPQSSKSRDIAEIQGMATCNCFGTPLKARRLPIVVGHSVDIIAVIRIGHRNFRRQ